MNRENVLSFIELGHQRIQQLKSQYYYVGEEVSDEEEFKGDDSEEEEASQKKSEPSEKQCFAVVDEYDEAASLRKLEEHWIDFYQYTIELSAANLSFVAVNQLEEIARLTEDA